jgi:energy-coupling factor transporter ATP-binding protein EcfA2
MTATLTQTTPLHLHRLEISNFMRVQALTVDAEGKHVVISGANGQGKTSALDAIWVALKGYSQKDIPEPINADSDRGSIKLDLGEFTVERKFTEHSTSLVVKANDGSKVNKPQQLLDSLLGKFSLDPVAFLSLRPQDQVDQLLAVLGVEPPADQVAEITGELLDPLPGESAEQYLMRLSGNDTGLFYIRRTEAGRFMDQKRGALTDQRQALEELGGPLGPEQSQASLAEYLQEMDRLQEVAKTRSQATNGALDARRVQREASARLTSLQADLVKSKATIEEIQQQIQILQGKRNAAIDAAGVLEKKVASAQCSFDDLKKYADQKEAEAAAVQDPSPLITDLRQRIAAAEEANKTHAKRRLASERLEEIEAEVDSAEHEHGILEAKLAGLRDLRAHLLDGIDLGIEGLQVGCGELRLNGVTFRQASMSQKIRVALAVAIRQSPRLRLLRLDDAEHLDRESRQLVLRLAAENGFQCIMACVSSDADELKVEIVGG